MKNLDPKIAVPLSIVVIVGALFLLLRSTGVLGPHYEPPAPLASQAANTANR